MGNISIEKGIYLLTKRLFKSESLILERFELFNEELRDTIANYFMILAIDRADEETSLKYLSYLNIHYDSQKIQFVFDNLYRVTDTGIWENTLNLGSIDDKAHKMDFKLIQQMLLVYLGRGPSWQEVGDMRGWTIWMQLKKKNKSLILDNLYDKINS